MHNLFWDDVTRVSRDGDTRTDPQRKLACLGGVLWGARRMIQGYWIDKRCTSQKNLTGQTAVITGGKVRSFKREFL
jgi:hypothetical protein